MLIKLVVGVEIIDVVCIYAPQIGLADEIKREFWEKLGDYTSKRETPFNGHVGTRADGYVGCIEVSDMRKKQWRGVNFGLHSCL